VRIEAGDDEGRERPPTSFPSAGVPVERVEHGGARGAEGVSGQGRRGIGGAPLWCPA
jgi:hypothetical protein